jgi:hypothetical protein
MHFMWLKFILYFPIHGPFIRLTAYHTKIHHIYIIFFTIYLFIYIFKMEFATCEKIFEWLCGKKIVKREAGANHSIYVTPVSEVR